jgi:hypothetical protein
MASDLLNGNAKIHNFLHFKWIRNQNEYNEPIEKPSCVICNPDSKIVIL